MIGQDGYGFGNCIRVRVSGFDLETLDFRAAGFRKGVGLLRLRD